MEILRYRKIEFLQWVPFLCSMLFFSGTLVAQESGEQTFVPCQEMPFLIQNYQADRQVLNNFYNPAGRSDNRWRNQSAVSYPEKSERIDRLSYDYLQKLETLDFEGLTQECQADYILFKRDLEEALRQSEVERQELDSVSRWYPFSARVYEIFALRRRGIQPDAQKVAEDMSEILDQIDSLKAELATENELSVLVIRKATETGNGLRDVLADINTFYKGYDPMFTWWTSDVFPKADTALKEYTELFQGKQIPDKNGIVSRKPVGKEELMRQLEYRMIPYTPEELTIIANEEFAWCEKEMLKASREMGYGNDWKAALESVKNTYVPPGEQPEAILKLYKTSVSFVKKHDLVTIPPLAEEVWGMYMMSPERQRTNAFFTGGWDITISYPTNTMDHEFKMMSMRGNNPNFSFATVHHELIPGHNLEFFMNARERTYRNFDSPFWMEGWALYWELLLWDMDFPSTPEERVGMLFWHMHRCARIIFSFNFHMGEWTPQECIDFLVEKVGHEYKNAESEIRGPLSSNSDPLYQVGYLTGGRQFYALKKELVDSGKMGIKEFHDKTIKLNAMPVEMIRNILTNAALQKDYKAHWKFYNQ
ncbi:DUF885 family protein [Robertkochia solimangrovi]|uniref:DUF885 family protein n=1 Tax=Robertkochia solimangrovi TaxID=2213046 RepID=UPI00117EF20D|nr:DUF885 family protein [Robertkochia solimangrovi]TRZ45088.1 DUF885 domain-containing protein [Robertkochia solimangrovi]